MIGLAGVLRRLVMATVLGAVGLPLAGAFFGPPAAALDLERRRMLNFAEHKPWRAVGQVNVAGYAARSMCTGALIAEDLVLTAAHCVMNPLTGRPYPPEDVHFVAGYRLGQKVGHSLAKSLAVHPDYVLADRVPTERVATDIALIRLADPIPRDKAPFFETGPAPAPETPLTLISYRQDRTEALTRQRGCDLIERRGAVMQLGCSVTYGASGSPVFMDETTHPRIVAVLAAMSTDERHPVAYAVAVQDAIGKVLAALK